MALRKGDKTNFNTLLKTAKLGDLCLMECKDAVTGDYRAVLCAVNRTNGEYQMVPLGHLCTDDPYVLYTPPLGGV